MDKKVILIWLFIFLISPINSFGAPNISNVGGTFINESAITISGSDFGQKSQAEPLISSYDNPTSSNNWSNGSIGGSWSTGGNPVLTNSSPRASIPQSSNKISYNASGDYDTIRYNHPIPEDKIYVSFWMYRDHPTLNMTTGSGNNGKFLRIYQSSSTSHGNIVYSLECTGSGNAQALYSSGDNMANCSGWSIPYTACSAAKYSSLTFNAWERACLPSMQTWEHYEYYIDYPTSLGGNDGLNLFMKDGKTLARSINIAVNGSGQTNNRRWILIGQVSGGRTVSYNEYIDQIYIDNTQAHVFLSDSPSVSWPDNGFFHHNEVQFCSSWSDGSITFRFNQGSFSEGQIVYLYVVDANGNINSQGYPITIGSGGVSDNPPTVNITSPTSQPTFTSSEQAINLSGSASDDNGITSITWMNNRGDQGTAYNYSGDWTSWSIPNISLQEGENIITVTATDTNNQTSADTLTVTYSSSGTDYPPGDVTDFTAQPGDSEIVLNWTNPTDSDFKGTLICFSTGSDPYPATHNDGTFVCDREAAPGSSDSFKVAGLVNGIKYNYSAFTYDEAGNYSETAHVSATPNPSSGTVQAWSANEQADDYSWEDSGSTWCARVLIEGTSIIQSGNQVILGFQGRDSGDYRIRKVSIAEADPNGGEGDVIDSTWTRVTFDGSSDSSWGTDVATVPSGTEKLSDPVYLSIEPGKDYYVTYLLESPSVYLRTPSYYRELYFDGVDHANDIDWSGNGHSTYAARLHAIASIYVVNNGDDTTAPGDVSGFTATSGPGQITLTWTNPTDTDFAGVMIRYRTDGTNPQNKGDGLPIPNGNDGKIAGSPGQNMSYVHTNLDPDKHYYYSAFSYDTSNNYSQTAYADAQPLSPNAPVIQSFTGVPSSLNNPGETTTFNVSATDPDGDALTYTINFGDGTANGSENQVVHTYAAQGTYTATATVDDGNGHSVGQSLQVTVNDIPPDKPTNVSAN